MHHFPYAYHLFLAIVYVCSFGILMDMSEDA